MLNTTLRGLLSPLWICLLSCTLAYPALGKTKCAPGKIPNPKICKGLKRDVSGCCKKQTRKKRKSVFDNFPRKSRSSSWFSSWLPIKEFNGIGLKSDFYNSRKGVDHGLGIAARGGFLGVFGMGWIGSANYRFNSQMISGHAGFDAYLMVLGLQCGLAWQVDRLQNRNDLGINYGLKLLRPASYPMFFTVGGRVYTEAPSEFFISFSIFTSTDGRPF